MNPHYLIRMLVFALSVIANGFSAVAGPVETASYVLRPNDVVKLAVFNEEALSSQTRVLQTGEAMLPLIGPVKVAGLTLSAAIEKVRALYDADYLVDPKVTMTVDDYALQQVSVLGSVAKPGDIPIPSSGKLDMASAIAAAGGLSARADPSQILLTRIDGSTGIFSRSGIERGNQVQLMPGDRIVVGQSRFVNHSVTVVGEVKTVGSIPFPLDGDLDIISAIARAGGFNEVANQRKISVNRKGRVIVVDVKEASANGANIFKLEPDDIITVPARLF